MTIRREPKFITAHALQRLAKRQPRPPKVRNPGESRTRALVAERSGGWCEICGVMRAESVHHRRKRSQGGPWSGSNCVAACGDGVRGCHGWAELNPDAAHKKGFHLRPGEKPAETPVISGLHGRVPVLLDDEGGIAPVGGPAYGA
ncbi:HNH endonuclease [Nocardia sp. NBC_00511]|uniref:HNH endonuclease n=1 Tax=Nocardia sp. NBC_00511 TaxID=2903591 RepID=UPI0030E4B915